MATKTEELAKLKEDLAELKKHLPEHCSGTKEYTNRHHASPKLWEKIEDLEERIKALEAEIAGS